MYVPSQREPETCVYLCITELDYVKDYGNDDVQEAEEYLQVNTV